MKNVFLLFACVLPISVMAQSITFTWDSTKKELTTNDSFKVLKDHAIKVARDDSQFIFDKLHYQTGSPIELAKDVEKPEVIEFKMLPKTALSGKKDLKFILTYTPTGDSSKVQVISIPIAQNAGTTRAEVRKGTEKERIIGGWISNGYISTPYKEQEDKVHLCFDERGKMLSKSPVNVDQSDEFIIHIVAPASEIDFYDVKVTIGDYAPSDLSIRPFDALSKPGDKATIQAEFDDTFKEIIIYKGPFTTDRFEFQITYNDEANKKTWHSDPYSIRINKLFHVGVGVSFLQTSLSAPDFKVAPLASGGNTIIAVNDGNRTMVTFNVIWYWSVLHAPGRSLITRGRDVLKDERAFSIKRIFPTLGVSLDGEFDENFFAGGVYEFARGGSFIFGGHYGKFKQLAMPEFTLGETVFQGTNDDIVTSNKWDWGFFFGINIDTRIFNTLVNSRGN